MDQYIALNKRILDTGTMVENPRTGVGCLTVVNAVLTYDMSDNKIPLVTTRKAPWKLAIAELLGYIRGETDAQVFKDLGAPSWMANANDNKAWLNNPHRKGENDMGFVYGAVGRRWGGQFPERKPIDQLRKIVDDLNRGIDDRGEILSFWDPSSFEYGCLRPCMHTHQFSLLGDDLYISSIQRSTDAPLGLVANMVQVVAFARLMAQIASHGTGRQITARSGTHLSVNTHIYENQIDLMRTQIAREPYPMPTLEINPDIKTLEDLETWVTVDDFKITNYRYHEPIRYPFTV